MTSISSLSIVWNWQLLRKLAIISTLLFSVLNVKAQLINSENGHTIPVHGEVRVVLIFAQIDPTNACVTPNPSTEWPNGKNPLAAQEFFDQTASSSPTELITKVYQEASFGDYQVVASVLKKVVTVDDCIDTRDQVVAILGTRLQDYIDGKELNPFYTSATGNAANDVLALDNYDLANKLGKVKPGTANQKIDVVIIIWRKNENITDGCKSGGGLEGTSQSFPSPILAAGGGSTLVDGIESMTEFVCCEGNCKGFVMQEYVHGMFGGNKWHDGGGAGQFTFNGFTNSWGLNVQIAGVGQSNTIASSFDRDRMGWLGFLDNFLTTTKTDLIAALDPAIMMETELQTDLKVTDFSSGNPSIQVRLRDFQRTGDAVRIKLPHLQDDPNYTGVYNQYLWLENHQLKSDLDDNVNLSATDGTPCPGPVDWVEGLYAYIQVGKDIKTDNLSSSVIFDDIPMSLGSWTYPFTADGNYDLQFGDLFDPMGASEPLCSFDNPTLPMLVIGGDKKLDPGIKSNPFTGHSDLFSVQDTDGNGETGSGDVFSNRSIFTTVPSPGESAIMPRPGPRQARPGKPARGAPRPSPRRGGRGRSGRP
ncbi:MAG: hypothetical protein IH948_09570, partial [Bacteroidetes bacterium]|nr:hypothetical protein [Bacteroidota bacterium]